MSDERFENLSEEAKARIVACKSPEEMLEVAKAEGQELSLDELDQAAGGWESSECNDFKPQPPHPC